MNKPRLIIFIGMLVLFGLTSGVVTLVHAEPQTYDLHRYVMSAGGMGGSTGSYTITSTLGQAISGLDVSGDHPMTSGFWTWIGKTVEEIYNYLPLIKK